MIGARQPISSETAGIWLAVQTGSAARHLVFTWRLANQCAVHVGRILTGEIEETFEPPKGQRKPPDLASGGRARAEKMTTEERSASAKAAASARWGAAVLAGVLFATSASGQDTARETAAIQEKAARAAAYGTAQPMVRQILQPGSSTARREYFRVEIHQGGLYEPSIASARNETWLQIACIHDVLSRRPSTRTSTGSACSRSTP